MQNGQILFSWDQKAVSNEMIINNKYYAPYCSMMKPHSFWECEKRSAYLFRLYADRLSLSLCPDASPLANLYRPLHVCIIGGERPLLRRCDP